MGSRVYPQWFIDELVDEEDKEKARSGELKPTDRVRLKCPIHGEYPNDTYVYTHIRITDGARLCGCYKCGVKDGKRKEKTKPFKVRTQSVTRQDRTKGVKPYPSWVIDELWDPIDKDRARTGVMSSRDCVYWTCSKHGRYPYPTLVGSHVRIKDFSRGRGCPVCGNEARAEGNARRFKKVRNYPQWFIEELANEEDKEKASLGTLTGEDFVDFICPKHGVYSQLVLNHIVISSGERKTSGTGCPGCTAGGYSSKAEYIVRDWLRDYRCVYNSRSEIESPAHHWMEIDIFLPDLSFGVECDGGYYHKECDLDYYHWEIKYRNVKNRALVPRWKGYHKYKDDKCAEKGIKLIHVISEDVIDFPEQTKAYILEELEKWKQTLCLE